MESRVIRTSFFLNNFYETLVSWLVAIEFRSNAGETVRLHLFPNKWKKTKKSTVQTAAGMAEEEFWVEEQNICSKKKQQKKQKKNARTRAAGQAESPKTKEKKKKKNFKIKSPAAITGFQIDGRDLNERNSPKLPKKMNEF